MRAAAHLCDESSAYKACKDANTSMSQQVQKLGECFPHGRQLQLATQYPALPGAQVELITWRPAKHTRSLGPAGGCKVYGKALV